MKECVYCGSTQDLGKDHVPPKNLFPKPRPSNLVTVPACGSCNLGASKDDEYFRTVVAMRHDVADHPTIRRLLPTLYRGLARDEGRGLLASIANDIRTVERRTPSGVYIDTAPTYHVDLARLDRVVRRCLMGLFAVNLGRRVPDDFEALVYSFAGVNDTRGAQRMLEQAQMIAKGPGILVGDDVLRYWYQEAIDRVSCTGWVFSFYSML